MAQLHVDRIELKLKHLRESRDLVADIPDAVAVFDKLIRTQGINLMFCKAALGASKR